MVVSICCRVNYFFVSKMAAQNCSFPSVFLLIVAAVLGSVKVDLLARRENGLRLTLQEHKFCFRPQTVKKPFKTPQVLK